MSPITSARYATAEHTAIATVLVMDNGGTSGGFSVGFFRVAPELTLAKKQK